VTLVHTLREAGEAGVRLETALKKIADIKPVFTLDQGSIFGPLRTQLDRLERR